MYHQPDLFVFVCKHLTPMYLNYPGKEKEQAKEEILIVQASSRNG